MIKFLFIFLTFFIFPNALKPTLKENALISLGARKSHKEGFFAGTLIKTPHGYKQIEHIKINDLVLGPDLQGNNYPRRVLDCQKEKLKKYIQVLLEGQSINVAPKQKFYCGSTNSWVYAKDLKNVNSESIIEHCKKKAKVYRLTVEGHHLLVTPQDIIAHNASRALVQCATIALEHMILTNPAQAILGASLDLNTIKAHVQQKMPALAYLEKCINTPLAKKEYAADLLKARDYYLSQRRELINIRDQFIQMKSDMESNSGSFYSSFPIDYVLAKVNLSLELMNNPTLEQEANFNAKQAHELCQLRTFELTRLEEQIKALQIHLGMHFEAVLNQYLYASQQHERSYEYLVKFINKDPAATLPIILECFDQVIVCECNLKKLEDNIKAVKITFGYYKNSEQAYMLRETSNIQDVLNDEMQILEYEKKIVYEGEEIQRMKSRLDLELRYRGINPRDRAERHCANYRAQDNVFQSQIIQDVEKKRLTLQYPVEHPQKNYIYAQDNKNAAKEEKQKKIIDELIQNAKPGEITSDKKMKQYELPGGKEDALKDFERLELSEIEGIKIGKMGVQMDGRRVIVRDSTLDKRPTLEIQDPASDKKIKIRYGNKPGI